MLFDVYLYKQSARAACKIYKTNRYFNLSSKKKLHAIKLPLFRGQLSKGDIRKNANAELSKAFYKISPVTEAGIFHFRDIDDLYIIFLFLKPNTCICTSSIINLFICYDHGNFSII